MRDTTPPGATPTDGEPGDTQPLDPGDLPATAPEPAATTKPIPVVEPVEASPQTPRSRRRVWPFVAVGVVLVLLVVAFFIADSLAKDYARDYIRTRIVEVLNIDPATPVSVDIGTGSVLLQALTGKLDRVDITADQVTFGALTGTATVRAEQVPLDAEAPVGSLDITFAVAEGDVAALAGNLSGLQLESIALQQPEIVATTSFNLLFVTLPVGIGLTPSVDAGKLVFTPSSIRINDESIAAEDLLDNPVLGGLARQLLAQQTFCVAEYLPVGLTATDANVSGDDLVIRVTGDGVALGGPDLTTMGTCA